MDIYVKRIADSNIRDIGSLDVSSLEKAESFCLIIENPFIQLDKWVTPTAMKKHCSLVIAPSKLPFTGYTSPIVSFCDKYHIPFVDMFLQENIQNNFVYRYNCTFINMAVNSDIKQLLLVGTDPYCSYVNIPDDAEIIGICSDTLNFNNIAELRAPGRIFGVNKLEKAIKDNRIWYTNPKAKYSLSARMRAYMKDTTETQKV